jgi:hypothetical protein
MAATRPAGTRAPAKWIDESYQASAPAKLAAAARG